MKVTQYSDSGSFCDKVLPFLLQRVNAIGL